MPYIPIILGWLFSVIGVFLPHTAFAETANTPWDTVRMQGLAAGRTYGIASGTGFFVNGGYIVTNAHVVQNCLTISVRGAIPPTRVRLIATDEAHDLALLYTNIIPKRVANLRSNSGLKPGDLVFIVGYPLDHGKTGNYNFTQAKVIGFEGNFDQSPRIEITDSVEHGNSGGPLIDAGGNVIGVIVAKATYSYSNNQPFANASTTKETRGVAIGLSLLRNFLQRHNAYYNANTTYDIFTEYRPDRRARQYIVNIHCVQDKH